MELALPRFTMAEGTQGKHSPWPVAKEAPASPSPNRSEVNCGGPRWSSKQLVLHSVYFDLDALASSYELVDVRKCKDLSVTVLYKPGEDDTPAKSGMAASDSVSQLESGAGDVRKVVRHRDEPMGSEMTQPMRPQSRHELPAPTVDLVAGKCKPGKMIRTVSASPLTVDMTVSCKPEPDSVQQGVNADVLPPTDSVGMSAADVNTSTPVVTAPGLGGSDGRLTLKKSPSGDLSESSELLPSPGWSSSSSSSSSLSSSSSPTLLWGTAQNSSPSFSPNRVKEGQSQISLSEDSLFNVSPLSPIEPNRENGKPQPNGVLLPTILDEFSDSVLGEPISYARLQQAPGSESPLSLPVYAWPPRATLMMDPLIQTVLPPPPPPKRDMPPTGTTWVVPPGVAEKTRMTYAGIPGCPYIFFGVRLTPIYRWKPGIWLATPSPALPRISGSPVSCLDSLSCVDPLLGSILS